MTTPLLHQELSPCSLQRLDEHGLGPQGPGTLSYIKNSRGERIACYYWPAEGGTPKAVIHCMHGHGAYLCYDYMKAKAPGLLGTYKGSWIETLNKAGYSVCGIDLHGAGRSEGLRCYTAKFDHYVDEQCQFIRLAGEQGMPGFPPILPADAPAPPSTTSGVKPVPRYLLGASKGGCLATVIALRMPEVVSGVVLLAPMLSLERLGNTGINKYLKHLAPLVSFLFPTFPVAKTTKSALYPDLQAIYDSDINTWKLPTRARNAYEYMRVTHALMHGGLEKVNFPFLVYHGLHDDMTDLEGSRALYERAQSKDKTLRWLNHMWHIIMKEPGNTGILADIIDWLDERTKATASKAFPSNAALCKQLRAQADQEYAQLAKTRPELVARFASSDNNGAATFPVTANGAR